jgi:altronate dehydratase large subunit
MAEAALRSIHGRRRPSGAFGIRHHLLVIPSVLCAAQAVKVIAERVPRAIAIEHQHGCAQLGGDAHLTEQILRNLGTHPNVAGALVVSLGCETVQGLGLSREIERRGQRTEFVGIQQSGGTLAAISAGREALERLGAAASADPELDVVWNDLRVGIEAGWLSLPAQQARVMSEVIDALLEEGATVIQAIPLDQTGDRVTLPGLARRPTVTTSYATGPSARGLVVMPAPGTRIAQKTGLAAAGAHVILSPLVEGLPAGCPVAPVVHVGIAPYARPFAQDVEVMVDETPALGAGRAVLAALQAACREETVMEALGTFEMAIHRIAPTM